MLFAAHTQLDAALQVASNVAQSQAALQLLVPQGDYAAALDVMEDIRVRSQALQCLALLCAGMQVCRAFQGMYWHLAWQQPFRTCCCRPCATSLALSCAPACQCLPNVLLDSRFEHLQCPGRPCNHCVPAGHHAERASDHAAQPEAPTPGAGWHCRCGGSAHGLGLPASGPVPSCGGNHRPCGGGAAAGWQP